MYNLLTLWRDEYRAGKSYNSTNTSTKGYEYISIRKCELSGILWSRATLMHPNPALVLATLKHA